MVGVLLEHSDPRSSRTPVSAQRLQGVDQATRFDALVEVRWGRSHVASESAAEQGDGSRGSRGAPRWGESPLTAR